MALLPKFLTDPNRFNVGLNTFPFQGIAPDQVEARANKLSSIFWKKRSKLLYLYLF